MTYEAKSAIFQSLADEKLSSLGKRTFTQKNFAEKEHDVVDILPRIHFRTLAIALIDGRTFEAADFLAARAAGGFPKLSQQRTSPLALKPNDGCKVAGYERLSNIGFIRRFITELQATTTDPSEHARLDSFRPTGGAAAENKLNIKDLRRLRELGQWLMVRDLDDPFDKLFNWETWSIGDLMLIGDFTKTNNAQNSVQQSNQTGSEFDKKNRGDLGPYGGPDGWKTQRASMVDFADKMRHNTDKLSALRDAQKSARSPEAHKDLQKKAASAKLETKSFVAEDAAIENPAFELDLSHDDLSEYVRMSDNYDKDTDWIKIPDGLTPSQLKHVEKRISRLISDQKTTALVGRTSRSQREVAIFRECYFRSKPRVDAMSKDLGLEWPDSWDNQTNGPKLVDLIMTSTKSQRGETVVRDLDRGVRGFADFRTDLPGKTFDARVVTLVAFVVSWGFLMLFSMWLFQDSSPGKTLVLAALAAVVFNQILSHSASFNPRLFYGLMAALPILLVVMILANNTNGARIQNELNQRSDEFIRYVK